MNGEELFKEERAKELEMKFPNFGQEKIIEICKKEWNSLDTDTRSEYQCYAFQISHQRKKNEYEIFSDFLEQQMAIMKERAPLESISFQLANILEIWNELKPDERIEYTYGKLS